MITALGVVVGGALGVGTPGSAVVPPGGYGHQLKLLDIVGIGMAPGMISWRPMFRGCALHRRRATRRARMKTCRMKSRGKMVHCNLWRSAPGVRVRNLQDGIKDDVHHSTATTGKHIFPQG